MSGLNCDAHGNLARFCRLNYPEYEIVVVVSIASGPVIPVIEKLRADIPARCIRLITNVSHLGTIDRMNNLCRLTKLADYDHLVVSDSDVRVKPDYLQQITADFWERRSKTMLI